jgi:hypothetical protein
VYLLEGLAALAVAAVPAHHPPAVTVQSGDTLTAIAARADVCGNAADYPGLARASGIRNPDRIGVGQQVTVVCSTTGPHSPAATLTSYTGRRAARSYAGRHRGASYSGHHDQWDGQHYPGGCGDGDGDGLGDYPCSLLHHGGTTGYAPRHARSAYRASSASSGGSGGYSGNISTSSGPGGSYGACVVARESGGNSQIMNSSGHYGLYQFSAGTWEAYGGSAADFGHASVAEQERVFSNALAQGGQSNWSPYDGC